MENLQTKIAQANIQFFILPSVSHTLVFQKNTDVNCKEISFM